MMGFFSGLFNKKKEQSVDKYYKWREKLGKESVDAWMDELVKHHDRIRPIFDDEQFQLEMINPIVKEKALGGLACDCEPNGNGPFGFIEANPIPVNGPIGELAYLSRLETVHGERLLFHRIGAIQEIDVFEAVTFSGRAWFVFFLNMYHPRRSRAAPDGFCFNEKIWTLSGYHNFCENFPYDFAEIKRESKLEMAYLPKSYIAQKLQQRAYQRPLAHKANLDIVKRRLSSWQNQQCQQVTLSENKSESQPQSLPTELFNSVNDKISDANFSKDINKYQQINTYENDKHGNHNKGVSCDYIQLKIEYYSKKEYAIHYESNGKYPFPSDYDNDLFMFCCYTVQIISQFGTHPLGKILAALLENMSVGSINRIMNYEYNFPDVDSLYILSIGYGLKLDNTICQVICEEIFTERPREVQYNGYGNKSFHLSISPLVFKSNGFGILGKDVNYFGFHSVFCFLNYFSKKYSVQDTFIRALSLTSNYSGRFMISNKFPSGDILGLANIIMKEVKKKVTTIRQ